MKNQLIKQLFTIYQIKMIINIVLPRPRNHKNQGNSMKIAIIIAAILVQFATCEFLPVKQTPTHQFSSQQECINSSLATNDTSIPMVNCYNIQYSIILGIGTPPQYFDLQFDTGSNVLWVPSSPAIPNVQPIFDCGGSSTCRSTDVSYSLEYADYSFVEGNVGSEIVSVEDTVISVNNSILLVNSEANMSFSGDTVGIVGMGYTSLPNFLDQAYSAGQILTNVFILALGEVDGSTLISNATTSSIIYYNTLPQDILNDTLYSYVAGSGYWELNLIGVMADGQDLTSYAVSLAVIDSGTSLFYLNPSLLTALANEYLNPHLCSTNSGGGYNCACLSIQNKMPNLQFMFPGVQITIPVDAYVFNQGLGVCYVMLLSLEDVSDQVLLGDTLFHQYAITFDKNEGKVGFYGDTQVIEIFGANGQGFSISQYLMLAFQLLFLLMGLFLLYHLRINGRLERKAVKKLQAENTIQTPVSGKEAWLVQMGDSPYAFQPQGKVLYMGQTKYAYQQRMNSNL